MRHRRGADQCRHGARVGRTLGCSTAPGLGGAGAGTGARRRARPATSAAPGAAASPQPVVRATHAQLHGVAGGGRL